MAERSVVAKLRLEVGDYKKNAADAAKATREIGTAAEETAKKSQQSQQQQTSGMGKFAASVRENEQAWTTAGTAVTAFGAVAAAGVGMAVSAYADFDAQMSGVQAATHETTDNMELLRDAAMRAGADTAFSAVEAAQGIEELAKAGVSTTDILNGGLNGALDLAAAGSLSVAEAAETTASALTQFKLEGDQATHVADLLAAGAGKAQGSVHDMGAALNQAGLVANQTGLDIEETTGALAMFASAGLTGSDAGTSFKSMLQALTPSSKEAATLMSDLGISAYDAQGNFIGMSEFAGVLQGALGDLTVEQQNATLKTIFGADAVRAASLVMQQGAAGVEAWETKVNDAGYAAETAALMTDNLKGDLERLGGAWDTLMIRMGEGANGPFRSVVQTAESALDWFGALPDPVLNVATGLGTLAGGAGLAAGAFLLVAPRVFDVVKGFQDLNKSHPGVTSGLGKVAKAAGLVGAAFAATQLISGFVQSMESARMGAEELASTLDGLSSSEDVIGDVFSDIFKPEDIARGEDFRNLLLDIANPGMADSFNEWSASILNMETGFGKTGERLAEVGDHLAALSENDLPAAQAQFQAFWQEAGGDQAAAQALLDTMPAFRDSLFGVAEGLGVTADEATIMALATGELTPELEAAYAALTEAEAAEKALAEAAEESTATVEGQKEAVDALVDSLSEFYGNVLSAREAERQLEESVDKLTESIKENGTTMDINTEKGRANQSALDDVASSSWGVIDAMKNNNATAGELQAKMTELREKFVAAAQGAGYNADEANRLADEMGLIPENVNTHVSVTGVAAAEEAVNGLVTRLGDKSVSIPVYTSYKGGAIMSGPIGISLDADGGLHKNGVKQYADGGIDTAGSYVPRVPQIRKGGNTVMWAEQETGWESYISGKPSMRARNLQVFADTGRLLGVPGFADGALRGNYQSAAAWAAPQINVTTAAAPAYEGPLVHVDRVVQGTPQDIGHEVAWALIGRV